MWLSGVIAFAPKAIREGHAWQPIVWSLIGSIIICKFLIQPALTRRRIRTNTSSEQPLTLDFTDPGIHIEAEGFGAFDRVWTELRWLEPSDKGVAMGFTDGMAHWIPNRAFQSAEMRHAFINDIARKLPK